MDDIIAAAWQGEESLLTASVRGSHVRLDELLAPDFSEIGQSGRRWSRNDVIDSLVAEPERASSAAFSERAAALIATDTVLLTYRLDFGSRTSRRSSIWRWDGTSVRCVFHQGTPLTADQ